MSYNGERKAESLHKELVIAMKERIKTNRTGGSMLYAAFFACTSLAGLSAAASTCIISLPEGDRDPHSSRPSAPYAIDAGAGATFILDSALEARFSTYGASLGTTNGTGITTMPIGFGFSIR